MLAADVWRVLDLFDEAGVRVWVDGGWAGDACLGEQTRTHGDLDIVVEQRHVEAAVGALRAARYADVPRDDTTPWNFVLGDAEGHEVDFHVIELDDRGRGIYGPPENGDFYPAAALTGEGTICGRRVACMTPEYLVASHSGYELDETDRLDVLRLCERFGIAVPDAVRAL
jgi:lincosamide nucleotidyltransferase A/C/D/E